MSNAANFVPSSIDYPLSTSYRHLLLVRVGRKESIPIGFTIPSALGFLAVSDSDGPGMQCASRSRLVHHTLAPVLSTVSLHGFLYRRDFKDRCILILQYGAIHHDIHRFDRPVVLRSSSPGIENRRERSYNLKFSRVRVYLTSVRFFCR